jgi:hypothetical protein
MEHVIIGVDPHKLSATIEVVDHRETALGSGRFTTDKAGFAAMRKYAAAQNHSTRGLLASRHRRAPISATNIAVTTISSPSQLSGGRDSRHPSAVAGSGEPPGVD